jgi:hypothetical protein
MAIQQAQSSTCSGYCECFVYSDCSGASLIFLPLQCPPPPLSSANIFYPLSQYMAKIRLFVPPLRHLVAIHAFCHPTTLKVVSILCWHSNFCESVERIEMGPWPIVRFHPPDFGFVCNGPVLVIRQIFALEDAIWFPRLLA